MEEYYCPHCGAILNDQDGFDPSVGTWRCEECGRLLMDDDIFEGDTYEGVAWYCDECGALLNRQPGFTDSGSTWRCTECGYLNGTTEDDIIDEEDTRLRCPNCDAVLEDQCCFSEYNNDWKCAECGALLHRSSSSDSFNIDERLRCPNCDAVLEDQCCFSDYDDDWECTECGAHLHHSYSSDPYEIVDPDEEYDGDYEEEEVYSSHEDDEHVHSEDEVDIEYDHSENSTIPSKMSWKRRHWKFLFVLSLLGILILTGMIAAYEIHLLIPVKNNSHDMIGLYYEEVIEKLQESGFCWIQEFPIQDLGVESIQQENKVTEVKIGWKSTFTADAQMPSNFPIRVTYHTVKLIQVPVSSKDVKGKPYTEIFKTFSDAGFINIKLVTDYDIITGWISSENEIEKITIDGDKRFSIDEKFRPDAEVVITYHALRKDRPKDK